VEGRGIDLTHFDFRTLPAIGFSHFIASVLLGGRGLKTGANSKFYSTYVLG